MTLLEIYDVGEVFTEVNAAHFPNQFVKHLLIKRGLFINHKRKKEKKKKVVVRRKTARLQNISERTLWIKLRPIIC